MTSTALARSVAVEDAQSTGALLRPRTDAGKNTTFTIRSPTARWTRRPPTNRSTTASTWWRCSSAAVRRQRDGAVAPAARSLRQQRQRLVLVGTRARDGVPQAYANILLWRHMVRPPGQVHGITT